MRESAARDAGDLQTVPFRFELNINGHAEGALPLSPSLRKNSNT